MSFCAASLGTFSFKTMLGTGASGKAFSRSDLDGGLIVVMLLVNPRFIVEELVAHNLDVDYLLDVGRDAAGCCLGGNR